MKESKFIDKNLDRWKENEKIISVKDNNPHQLSQLFIKTTDDLSYAYTYYQNRSVRLYLNSVAKQLFNRINKSEQFRVSSVQHFFSFTVPLSFYKARKELLISFFLFVIAMLIGVLSSKYDPEFAQLILGEKYVNMTHENIAKNDPMAVYKSMAPFNMFFGITLNNCLVALRTFVMGIFMAIGTIIIMIQNGIMVGCFQYFFVEQGMFRESFLTIWQHGVFEISSIIMAGGAGLVLGKGLIFPGNYSRFQALQISAKNGLTIIIGIMPILIIAGFIEGFYTRFTEIPDLIRISTILLSLVIIIGYFILLPRYRNKNNTSTQLQSDSIEPINDTIFNSDRIISVSEAFMITFSQLKKYITKLLKWSLSLALILPVATLIISSAELYSFSEDQYYIKLTDIITGNIPGIIILLIGFTILNLLTIKIEVASNIKQTKKKISIYTVSQVLLMQIVIHSSLLIPAKEFSLIIYVCLTIFSALIYNVYAKEGISIFRAIKLCFEYLKMSYSKFVFLSVRFFIMAILFYFVFSTLIARVFSDFIQMNLFGSIDLGWKILSYINIYFFSFIGLLIYSVFYVANQILYYNLYETTYAKGLQKRIKSIGINNRIRGLVRE